MTNVPLVVLLLAGMMLGEAGVLGPEAAKAVGHVALNRVAAEGYPNNLLSVIQQGFYGWEYPTAEYVRLAYEVLNEDDVTNGCLYALSRQDREMLKARRGDVVFGNGIYQLHLYKTWPANTEEVDGVRKQSTPSL